MADFPNSINDITPVSSPNIQNVAIVSSAVDLLVSLDPSSPMPATIVDGGNVTLGSKSDLPSGNTDNTPVSVVSIWKYISSLWQSVRSLTNAARSTATNVLTVQQVDPNGYTPQFNSVGEQKVFNPPAAMFPEYRSPNDFSAVYTSSTSLTASGLLFTVDDSISRVTSIMYKTSGGTWTGLFNGRGGVSISCASNIITVSGAGTPFSNTDTYYDVNLIGPKKGYDNTLDIIKTIDQSPLSSSYILDSLLDAVNTASGTTYFPSSTGLSMDGFRDLTLTGYIIEGDAVTDTIELQVTNDEDPTDATAWITIYGYNVAANNIVNKITTGGVAGIYGFAWDFENCNFSLVRAKIVTADSTNTITLKMRRKAI
jgi:hypothetical protein